MTELQTIKTARIRAGIGSDKALMEDCGLSYSTYACKRKKNPGDFRLWELRQIIKHTNMPDALILELIKGEKT